MHYSAVLKCSRLLFLVFVMIGFGVPQAWAQTQVLVDATRDSGTWWNPNTGFYDPNLPHQGKALADYMRAQGMQVTELGGPVTITCDMLSQYHVVFVASPYAGLFGNPTYSASELTAFTTYVANGGRLVLFSDHKCNGACDDDVLPQALGLDFTGSLPVSNITSFNPHPITTGVTSLLFPAGSYVSTAPASATMLGFIDGLPVMGITPFGSWTIFFIGDINGIEVVPQPFVNNLLAHMLSGAQLVNACPVPTIGAVIAEVATLDLNAGETGSLTNKLAAAEDSLGRGNDRAAINQLNAFINEIQALQLSGRLDATTANGLISAAQGIIDSIP